MAEEIKKGFSGKEENLIKAVQSKTRPEFAAKVAEAVCKISTIEEASWWIDNRTALEMHSGTYADMNIIVAHLGGGITLSVHSGGKAVDIISDDEGPFSPERAGRVPCRDLIDLCYSGRFDHAAVRRMLRGGGGLIAYLGTNDCVEIEARIAAGDDRAELVYESLAYQVAKGIGELATVGCGDVDRAAGHRPLLGPALEQQRLRLRPALGQELEPGGRHCRRGAGRHL